MVQSVATFCRIVFCLSFLFLIEYEAQAQDLFQQQLLGNPVSSYLLFLAAVVVVFISHFLLMKLVETRILKKLSERQPELYGSLVRLIRNPLRWLLVTMLVALGTELFILPTEAAMLIQNSLLALVAITVSYVLIRLTDVFVAILKPRVSKTPSKLDDQLLPILSKILKFFIVVITALLVIQNWGYDIGALLAGLGLGGLALALAAQKTLSNLISAIAILINRPFQIGDLVELQETTGTIEEIGIWNTRLRTLDGTLVTLPNSVVADSKIDNYTRRPARRTNFTIGVTYDTSYDKLQRALQILKDVMASNAGTLESMVFFQSYGESSLNLLCHHWCKYLEYADYIKCLEEINLEIKRQFEAESIEMAFPTRTLYLIEQKSESNS